MKTSLNVFDVRKKCNYFRNPLCYDFANDIEIYLNKKEIQEALGVKRRYTNCQQYVNMEFRSHGDNMLPYMKDLSPLLENGLRVLIYAGDADFICNWKGIYAWTESLEWSGKSGFDEAQMLTWKSKTTKDPVGEIRAYENLAFVKVYEAGHMVPLDQVIKLKTFLEKTLNCKSMTA
jgi:cathepsin A (carboxypeptidase C)